ncbi:hypothetical protein L9F63_002706, partial [Diploptera punctata]
NFLHLIYKYVRKNSYGLTGNRTRDLMNSIQEHWPLAHEAGQNKELELLTMVKDLPSGRITMDGCPLYSDILCCLLEVLGAVKQHKLVSNLLPKPLESALILYNSDCDCAAVVFLPFTDLRSLHEHGSYKLGVRDKTSALDYFR